MALSSRRETGCTFPWRDISLTPRGISNFERCDETNGRTPLYVATSLKTGVGDETWRKVGQRRIKVRTRLPLSAIRRLIPPTTLAFGLAFRLATPRKDLLMSICQNPPYFRDCQRENLLFSRTWWTCVVRRGEGERWVMS